MHIPLHSPYIDFMYGRYLQFRYLKWPLKMGGKAILISNKNVFVCIKSTQGPTTQFESNWVTSRQTHPRLRCFRGTSLCISGYLREVRDIGELYGITMAGWWYTYPSEKYYIVSWKYVPNRWKNKTVPNHRPAYNLG